MSKHSEMKKYWPLILIGGIALFMSFKGRAAGIIDMIKFRPKGISFGKFNLFNGVDFDATISIVNDTPVNVKVDSFMGRILYNNAPITNLSSLIPIEIPASSSADVVFSGKIVPLYLVGDIVDVIKNRDFKGKLRLEGVANTPLGRLPVNVNLT